MRYRYVYTIAPRAFSKTFITILGLILRCVFLPGTKTFICAPKKEQSGKVAKEKFDEIFDLFPLLRKEVLTYTTASDNIKLVFRNGSIFDVVAALDSQRGGRRHCGLIDEVRDHDADTIAEVVLPLMNVNRRTKARKVNPYEPHQAQFYMSSAGTKNSYCYDKLIEVLEQEIISPKSAFVFGCDYRVPMQHGLLDKQYLNEIKMSSTYKDDSFAREYLGRFTGSSSDAWFDFDKMMKYRKLLNPENTQKLKGQDNIFYLLSVDVGRLSCQTVVTVFKVFKRDTEFHKNVVNIYVLGKTEETKHFSIQALELKRIINAFDPKEVLIDGNGLGVGLLDFMVKDSYGGGGEYYPGYSSFNDDDYSLRLYPGTRNILYIMKANASLDGKIHGNCYSEVYSGKVSFLARETDIKTKLLGTQRGQKMSTESRAARCLPHELTSRLFEEMSNFRLKPTGNPSDIKLEKINQRMLSDKFSSFEYGLWRIKEIEEDYYKKKRRKGKNRTLTFYN